MMASILGTWPASERFTRLGACLLAQMFDQPAVYAAPQADELPDWQFVVGECHDNADAWVAAHPGDSIQRGWIYLRLDYLPEGLMHVFVAHSVIRTAAGALIDVTLPSLAPTGRFLRHPEEVGGFFGLLLNPESPKEFKVLEARFL